MTIKQYRDRALVILEKNGLTNAYLPIDYLIDDECRRLLNLPNRPLGAKPYLRWMTPLTGSSEKEQGISERGVSLIKRWEGLRLKAYLCPGNVWTIGYGHTATAKSGQVITTSEADRLLKQDLKVYEDGVKRLVQVPLTQGQYDALVSFAFNCGVGALQNSTLLRLVNQKRFIQAGQEFGRYVYAAGVVLPGLFSRRREERKLFLGEE